ncbi:type II toxin-antitoxin system Phd/YefM family antitoxin [Desulfosarcina variabilis]|uniref:type II toxin-antitoxin system Phd/YefM family antitoxin n=1 Tax=Desulfosarcina variabilis TaxID=2300 RepID=UPI003AFB2AEE
METISVADTKAHLSELLDRVEKGEEIVVTRRGRPVARLSPIKSRKKPFPSLVDFRSEIPPLKTAGSEVLRMIREDER